MGIWEHQSEYAGLPVFRFDHERLQPAAGDLPDAGDVAWCVATCEDYAPFADVWERFRADVDTARVTALLIGDWGLLDPEEAIYPAPLLAESAKSFPMLTSLFVGEVTGWESEISWIAHSDISPLLRAFRGLERLEIRGSGEVVLEPFESESLKVLRFESGGLPAGVVRAVGASDLPNLEHLDLWFGHEGYGGDATPADLAPLLSGDRFPALRRLGLEDAEFQDEIAAAVAGAPVVSRLETLSLAMGILTDRGAEALLSGQPLTHLRELDLHHHFLSEAMVERLRAALPGVRLDLEKAPDDFRHIAVAE